jgi:hypothetical protein
MIFTYDLIEFLVIQAAILPIAIAFFCSPYPAQNVTTIIKAFVSCPIVELTPRTLADN